MILSAAPTPTKTFTPRFSNTFTRTFTPTPTFTPTITFTNTPTVIATFPTNQPTYDPEKILVQLQPNVDIPVAMASLSVYGQPDAVGIDPTGIFPLDLNAGIVVMDAVTLTQDPTLALFFQAAQPDYYYYVQGCPVLAPTSASDPYYSTGTVVQACGTNMIDPAWPLTMIGAPCAWNFLSANLACPFTNSVTVAVIDTGVSSDYLTTNHPDLPSSIFVPGTNTVGGTGTIDDYGHGTHVTGIIAAQWSNAGGTNPCTTNTPPGPFNGGMAGVAGYPGLLKIMPVKSLNNIGKGDSWSVIQGLNFAVANGAKIINMSLGSTSIDPFEQAAVQSAVNANCLVVASAGNDTKVGGPLQPLEYPAAYAYATPFPKTAPGVVAVGAVDPTTAKAWYSNGGNGLSLVAPGGAAVGGFNSTQNILSCIANCPIAATVGGTSAAAFDPCDNNYGTDAGTSMAAPYVSGAAALMLALNPALPNYQLKTILQNTAKDLTLAPAKVGYDYYTGYGLLNICTALSAAKNAVPSPTYTTQPTYTPTPTPKYSPTFTPIPNITPIFTPDPIGCTSKGTEFWLAFPAHSPSGSFGSPPILPSLSFIIGSDTNATGTVVLPGGITKPFSVVAGSTTTVFVPITDELNPGSPGYTVPSQEWTESKGIHITSDQVISVIGASMESATSDAYLGLPVQVLGTSYAVLSYTNPTNSGFASYKFPSELAVVATQDRTVVMITPSQTVLSHTAGFAYPVTLNKGQTYTLLLTGAGLDLSGTLISSNYKVAVFGGHYDALVPSSYLTADFLIEQMVPISAWGTSFPTVPYAARKAGDQFRIIASQPNTTVHINGGLPTILGMPGQFFETNLNVPSDIEADKPVVVMQYATGTNFDKVPLTDPNMTTIPSVSQWLSSYLVQTMNTFNGFLNIIAPNSLLVVPPGGSPGSTSILMDGAYLPISSFTLHPNMPGYSYAQVGVTNNHHQLFAPQPFGLTVYGFSAYTYYDSYGYPGGMNLCVPPTPTPTFTPTFTFTPTPTLGVCQNNGFSAPIPGGQWNPVATGTPLGSTNENSVVFDAGSGSHMWLLSSSGVWDSSDGVNWNSHSLPTFLSGRTGQQSVTLNGKIYVVGGTIGGVLQSDVWSSSDGNTWNNVTSSANFGGRSGFGLFAFNGYMWLVGGVGSGGFMNDVWYSQNGSTWTQATGNGGFIPRAFMPCVVFNGQMWVIGGSSAYAPLADIWTSTNGTNWTQVTPIGTSFAARYYHHAVVCGNALWVIGGYGESSLFQDVWVSLDGVNWSLATGSTAFDDTKGTALSYANQVWVATYPGAGPANWVWNSPCCLIPTPTPTPNCCLVLQTMTPNPFGGGGLGYGVVLDKVNNALYAPNGGLNQIYKFPLPSGGPWGTVNPVGTLTFSNISGLAMGTDGFIYVGEYNGSILKVDPQGVQTTLALESGAGQIRGIAVVLNSSGYEDVYVTLQGGTVEVFPNNGGTYGPAVTVGMVAGGEPTGIVVFNNTVYVTDGGYNLISYPITGTYTYGPGSTLLSSLQNAFHMSTDGTNLYIASPGDLTYVAVNTSGVILNKCVVPTGGFATAVDPVSGEVYVQAPSAIYVMAHCSAVPLPTPTPTPGCCQLLQTIPGVTPGSLNYGLAFDSSRQALYATDTSSSQIVKYSIPSGGYGGLINPVGTTFSNLECLAMGGDGFLYVGESNGTILKVDPMGVITTVTVETGVGFVRGIAVDQTTEDIYVTLQGGTVEVFPNSGGTYGSPTAVGTVAGGEPTGIVVLNNFVYATNGGGEVISFQNTGSYTFTTGTVLLSSSLLTAFMMATDGSNLYVASSGDNSYVVLDTSGNVLNKCFTPTGGFGIAVDPISGKVYLLASNVIYVMSHCSNVHLPGKASKIPLHSSLLLQEGQATSTPTPKATFTPTATATATPSFSGLAIAAPNVSRNGEPIKFLVNLDKPSQIRLSLFSITGESVFQESTMGNMGINTLSWGLQNQAGSPVASGLYIFQLQADDGRGKRSQTGKVAVFH